VEDNRDQRLDDRDLRDHGALVAAADDEPEFGMLRGFVAQALELPLEGGAALARPPEARRELRLLDQPLGITVDQHTIGARQAYLHVAQGRRAGVEWVRGSPGAGTGKGSAVPDDNLTDPATGGLSRGPLAESGRVEAFSDGVLAIAITLLVLDLKVPEGEPGAVTGHLAVLWPAYVAYLASFLYIGVVWVNHHALFRRIRLVDGGVL